MMKKSPAIIFGLILCLCLFACSVQRTSQSGINQKQPDMGADDVGSSDNGADTAENEADFEKTNEEDTQRKLTLTTNGQKISITLYDTPAANALYDMLPLEQKYFSDTMLHPNSTGSRLFGENLTKASKNIVK